MINSMTRDELQEVFGEALSTLKVEIDAKIDAVLGAFPDGVVKSEELDAVRELAEGFQVKLEEALAPIAEALEGTQEALSKALDRVEAIEKRSVTKRSLEGQDNEDGTRSEPTLKSAVLAALRGEKVELS